MFYIHLTVADPGEEPRGPGPAYFWTILRPEGPKNIWSGTAFPPPPPLPFSQGLDPALPKHGER